MSEALERERATIARRRSLLLRGAGAPLWLVAAGVLTAIGAALFVAASTLTPPVAWTALGLCVGLFVAMTIVALALPLTLRRAKLFAGLLTTIAAVCLGAAAAIALIQYLR